MSFFLTAKMQSLAWQGVHAFSTKDLRKILHHLHPIKFYESLYRYQRLGILDQIATDVFTYPEVASNYPANDVLCSIVKVLRQGSYSYVTGESALAEHNDNRPRPDTLTIATTGESGEYETPYGRILFLHTNRSISELVSLTSSLPDKPLRIANKSLAELDIQRRQEVCMSSQFRLVPGWSPFSNKLGRVQIVPAYVRQELPPLSPKLEPYSCWKDLYASDVFWRKHLGWRMFKGLDGALYYQCAPTGDDRTEFMFRILRDRNRLADLESISHDRRNQIAMIDSMMHVSEDAEDNFISEMWTAVDAAMRSGLLLGLELAGCHPTVSLDLF